MPWEAVTAIATAFTGLVIFFTVLLGARQVRAATEQTKAMSAQLEQLQRATQLEGTKAVFAELRGAQFRRALDFVHNELPQRMQDPAFRERVTARGVDLSEHSERYVQVVFEEIGTYTKNGLLDSDTIYDGYAFTIVETWNALKDIIELQRRTWGTKGFWENYERLADEARRYIKLHWPEGPLARDTD